ncbi:MAG: AI-2E family transporter [Hungatella hathewayi]|nr:AI-2E family transporter [Hungatella hathewayi]
MDLNRETMNKIRKLILFTVVVVILGINYQRLFLLFGKLLGMLSPFLMGAAIAFILNVPMRSIEKHLMTGRKSRFRRPVSLCLTILAVAGVLGLVTFVVVPELVRTVMTLQSSIPAFLNEVKAQSEQLFIQYPEIVDYINGIEVDWKQVMEDTLSFLSSGAGTVLSGTLSAAFSIANGVVNFGIGFIFAIYILLQKENLARQMKKLMKAFLPAAVFTKTMEIAVLAEKTFSNFLAGQCLEAVILGMMFFITLSVLRMPYALLIGVLIAFTALIPIFGAFIGCVVGAFLMLMINPVSAVTFVAIFLVLQQVEGNLIYPHVVGNSVGLPSIWVLVAVTLGGSAFGVVGMLVFIPLCSVFYSLLRQEVNERLNKNRPSARPVKQMTRVKKTGEK